MVRRGRGSAGFALVAVLWILVAVGAAGIAFQAAAGAERRAIANARESLRGRWAAQAGLARVMHAVDSTLRRGQVGARTGAPVGMALPPVEFRLNEILVRALTFDARARINLNLADERQLTRLFESLGLGWPRSASLAAAVLDWRGPVAVGPRKVTAAGEYAATRSPRQGNGPFSAVEELRRVRGVTAAVYARVAPHVTVVGDGRVNVNAASAEVLATLPGFDRNAVSAILARRSTGPFRNEFEVLASLPREHQERIQADAGSLFDLLAFNPTDVEIWVTAQTDGTPAVSRLRAAVVLEGGSAVTVAGVDQW